MQHVVAEGVVGAVGAVKPSDWHARLTAWVGEEKGELSLLCFTCGLVAARFGWGMEWDGSFATWGRCGGAHRPPVVWSCVPLLFCTKKHDSGGGDVR